MDNCVHRWIIDPPHGPTSWGECKHCHARREFRNDATDEANKAISVKGSQVLKKRPNFPQMSLDDHKDRAYVEGLKGQK